MISCAASSHVAFSSGVRASARSTARETNSSGETRTSRNSRRAATRSRRSIVAVMSTVMNSVTCGAVNAELTIAAAVCLRTPLIGMRVSRVEWSVAARVGACSCPLEAGLPTRAVAD